MDFIQAIILGIVQGITEWLPISSKSHLILVQHLFGVIQPAIFDLALHMGSLIVLFVFFWKDIKELALGVLELERKSLSYAGMLVIATVPVAVVGFIFKEQIEAALSNLALMGSLFIVTAIMIFLSRYPAVKDKTLNYWNSLAIGIGQACAVFPGISRSGFTISTGMMLGVKKEDVAKFSFLMFIPAILGATVLEIGDLKSITDPLALIVGVIFAMIAGYISLKLLMNIIEKGKFWYFSAYCLILGIVVLIMAYG